MGKVFVLLLNMPSYTLLFVIKPPGAFGLPEDGKIVVPAGPGDIYSGAVDTLTGKVIGHGTLPRYRESPLEIAVTLQNGTARIEDDHLFLTLEASEDRLAVQHGTELASRFCVMLSGRAGSYFDAELIQAVNETERRQLHLHGFVTLLSVRAYNLVELAHQIEVSAADCSISDPVFDKASAYFYHALLLERELEHTNPLSFHAKLVVSEIMLNYHKAISTLLGDPSVDRDYQSRYRRYGIARPLWEDAERVRQLRNTYDIAHYSPNWDALDQAREHQAFAKTTAQSVMRAYIAWRKSETR